jgi:hypothetical protein
MCAWLDRAMSLLADVRVKRAEPSDAISECGFSPAVI